MYKRQYPYCDRRLTNKAYLSASIVTDISRSFTRKTAAKISWIDTEQNCVAITLLQKFAERSRPSHRLVLFTQPDFGRRQRTVPHSLGYFVGRTRIVADLRLIIQRHRSLIGMTGIPLLYPRHHSIAAFSAAFTVFLFWLFLALYAQSLLQTSLWGGESPKKTYNPPKQLPKINQFL